MKRPRACVVRLSLQIISSALLMLCLSTLSAQAQTSEGVREKSDAPVAGASATKAVANDSKQVNSKEVKPEQVNQEEVKQEELKQETDRALALRAEIKSAKNDEARARLRRELVDYLVARNRKAEALDVLREMAREDRFDPAGFYNTGNALLRLGDESAAVEAYRKAIAQRKGNYARAHNNLGVVLMRAGRWDEAYDSFLAALRLENFSYAEASYNMGRLYVARGETELAIREWRRTLFLDPAHTDAATSLAHALAAEGNIERALAVLDNFTTRNGAASAIANTRREIASNSTAVERKAGASNPYALTTVKGSGSSGTEARSVSNGAGNASTASTRQVTLDQESYDLLQRARAAREAGRDEEAVRNYRKVLVRRQGYFPAANLEQSYALINLNRYDEAIDSLRQVITRDGERYPIAYYHLARLYEQRGQLKLAVESYERAASAYGESNPQFLLDVSRVREKEGNYRAALAAVESYVEISKRLGRSPDWSTTRLAELRQKASTK